MKNSQRVLVLSTGPVDRRMAGSAIRSWGFACALSSACEVTLATPNANPIPGEGFATVGHVGNERLIVSLAQHHDVLILQGYQLAVFPQLSQLGKCIVVDLYDPFTLSNLHLERRYPMAERVRLNRDSVGVLRQQLAMGDFFLCGHERQLDYWLGMLSATNRLNPQNSDADPSFGNLIGIVPFSVRPDPPRHTRQILKGVHPGISATDRVVLWMGGIWDWFDPLTAVRAIHRISRSRHDVKMVFLGVGSPDPTVPKMRLHRAALSLSKDLGILDKHVFFIDWVPYEEVPNYLLEADIGIYIHQNHLETRYSIRTRIFDYIWARVPMVIAEGDVVGAKAAAAGVATAVPIGDVDSTASAIRAMLDTPDLRQSLHQRFDPLLEEFDWRRVAQPLVEYCRAPRRAADHANPFTKIVDEPIATGPVPLRKLPSRALAYVRGNGLGGLWTRARVELRRRGLRI